MATHRWGERDQTFCQVSCGLHGCRALHTLEVTGTAGMSAEGGLQRRGETHQALARGDGCRVGLRQGCWVMLSWLVTLDSDPVLMCTCSA